MHIKTVISGKLNKNQNIVIIGNKETNPEKYIDEKEKDYFQQRINDDKKIVSINRYSHWVYFVIIDDDKDEHVLLETIRKAASVIATNLTSQKTKEITVLSSDNKKDYCLAFAEGLLLSSYQFLKYLKEADKKKSSLTNIFIYNKNVKDKEIETLNIVTEAVCTARDMINEPVSYLNSSQLVEEIKNISKDSGFKLKIFDKKDIEKEGMGGLLAVNKGSIDPPAFCILEWKPKNAKNKEPFVLVGKGIVYDTGGLSLKPTLNSMDHMKSDMSGSAAVVCTMSAIAKAKLPVSIIALVPITDNRPDGNAYAPGDVITMHDGTTVEVLNTDAEGRMILADALSYAKKYKPQLVIDVATLTGAAAGAIGKYGIVAMGNADDKILNTLKKSGENVYERIVEFPFWEEYKDLLKSSIADLKNVGGRVAGAITAGKFLEHFTDYPYIHLDIAGPAFVNSKDSYRGKGGTGVGVRILFDFFNQFLEMP